MVYIPPGGLPARQLQEEEDGETTLPPDGLLGGLQYRLVVYTPPHGLHTA